MALTCSEIIPDLGLRCRQVNANTLAVCTPLDFPDHTPIQLYVVESNNTLELTDDGDILMHLHGIGLFDNKRLSNAVSKRAQRNNAAFINGEIKMIANRNHLHSAFSDYLKLILDIIDYEQETTAISDDTAEFISDVVAQIQRRNPSLNVKRDAILEGTTGMKHRYPLMVNNTPIDVTRPHHQSTGAILRRAVDIEKAGIANPLIIIDDRESRDRAEQEETLISMLCRTMLYSRLAHGDEPIHFD